MKRPIEFLDVVHCQGLSQWNSMCERVGLAIGCFILELRSDWLLSHAAGTQGQGQGHSTKQSGKAGTLEVEGPRDLSRTPTVRIKVNKSDLTLAFRGLWHWNRENFPRFRSFPSLLWRKSLGEFKPSRLGRDRPRGLLGRQKCTALAYVRAMYPHKRALCG